MESSEFIDRPRIEAPHLGLEAVLRILKLPTVHYRSDFGQMTNMKYLYGGLGVDVMHS